MSDRQDPRITIAPWLPGIARHYFKPDEDDTACGTPVWIGDRFRHTRDPFEVTCQRCFRTRLWRKDFADARRKYREGETP